MNLANKQKKDAKELSLYWKQSIYRKHPYNWNRVDSIFVHDLCIVQFKREEINVNLNKFGGVFVKMLYLLKN